jgi:hypothetical protein
MSTTELGDPNATYGSHPMKRAAAWGVNLDWFRAKMTAENCVVLTSHAREKRTGTKSFQAQSAEHAPGGFALNHEPGVILHFMKGGALKRKPNGGLVEVDSDTAKGGASASAFGKFQPAAAWSSSSARRTRSASPGARCSCTTTSALATSTRLHEYEKFAGYYRVLPKSGTWWTLPDGTKTQQLRLTLQETPTCASASSQ